MFLKAEQLIPDNGLYQFVSSAKLFTLSLKGDKKMNWKNTANGWGLITILLHWLSALTIIGLFVLGLWMVELTYYDSWYTKAPNIHKSVGILLFALTFVRIIWRHFNTKPDSIAGHTVLEKKGAEIVHSLLYILLFLIMLSGYLISTADSRAISVFGWFDVPATLSGIDKQEDIAGTVHLVLAISLIGLVVLHAFGAIKHHFIDKDDTLKRMFYFKKQQAYGEKCE